MQQRLRIAMLIESHRTYERNLLRGIAAYAHAHGPWSFLNLGGMPTGMDGGHKNSGMTRLKKWDPDGLLVRCEDHRLVSRIAKLGLPMVDLLGWNTYENVPAIDTSHEVVAKLAADQFIERGFQSFAYCGFNLLYYSEQRAKYFQEYLSSLGYSFHIFNGDQPSNATHSLALEARGAVDIAALEDWLRGLPRPIGIMACNDMRGQQVIDACSRQGILVPEEVAVIAVGNDDVICELCDPTLSSIEPNTRKMGYEAAELLHRMITHQEYRTQLIRTEPLGIVLRQSTDSLSVTDSQITIALHFIRRHACDGITVNDVLQRVRLSRSTLERRFIKLVGRSPKTEITRLQIKRVQQLLSRTDYRLVQIAQLAGFNHVEYMCKVFKDKTGMTPGQYRKKILMENGPDGASQLA